jgi:tetratricopeptide (TPR) repeat protein
MIKEKNDIEQMQQIKYRWVIYLIIIGLFSLIILPSRAGGEDQIFEKEARLGLMPDDTAKVNLLIQLGKHHCSRENDKALLYLQQALTLSSELNYNRGIAESFLWQGRVYYYLDEYILAESYLVKARELFEIAEDQENLAFCLYASGALHEINGNYIKAVEDFQASAELCRKIKDDELLSSCYIGLGKIFHKLNDFKKAFEYFRDAQKIKEKINDKYGIASAMTGIGEIFEAKGEFDSALFYYNQVYQIRLKINDIRHIASSQYKLGVLYIRMQRFDNAIPMLERAINTFEELDESYGFCIATIRLAQAQNEKGKKTEAETLAVNAMDIALSLENEELLSECYEIQSFIAVRNKDYEKAYNYILLHLQANENLVNQKNERIIKEMEARFHFQRIHADMENLKVKSEVQRKNILILIVFIGLMVIVLLLLLLIFRMKIKNHKRQKEIFKQEAIIRCQNETLAEKEKLLLEKQLETNNRELAAKTIEMMRVNETLLHIISKLQNMCKNNKEQQHLCHDINRIIRDIEQNTQKNIWKEFDTIFRNIHTEFYKKLLEKCPELTSSEIKIAALLKLNLNTKEIAAMTIKSEEGIKSARYRLRKKLQITSDEHLIPFLMQL